MRGETKDILISVVVGAGAGALVGFAVWWYAERKIEQGFSSGFEQMANRLGVGSSELRAQLNQGTLELRAELARQVEEQVRPAVRTELQRTLTSYNITPETGRRINLVLTAAERMGIL